MISDFWIFMLLWIPLAMLSSGIAVGAIWLYWKIGDRLKRRRINRRDALERQIAKLEKELGIAV